MHDSDSGFALLFLDIDHFRALNENLGQIAADQILIEVVARLSAAVRGDDLMARIGGDEFVLVLNGLTDEQRCAEKARRVLDKLGEPLRVDGGTQRMTGSIGVARYPVDAKDAQSLLRSAELAVAEAKHDGGNGFRFFSPGTGIADSTYADLAMRLRRVAERGELRLHYQPQVSLASGDIVGVEALVRWQHPELGLVPPGAFIPVAEETGLIISISEWVLREACRQAKVWREAKLPPLRVAVNLSARHFHYSSLPETVASTLAAAGMEAKHLELELTESAIMKNMEESSGILHELKSMGLRVAIDDFGTGYSSLSYLKRFPLDILKIDRSFIMNIPEDQDNAAIATAIIAMARSLNLEVIAEGVETREQFAFLRELGCNAVQGFLFSPALPKDEISEFLKVEPDLTSRIAEWEDMRY